MAYKATLDSRHTPPLIVGKATKPDKIDNIMKKQFDKQK